MISFKGYSYPKEVILQSVRWYKIRQCKYLNNVVEQDHRFVKRKMRQAMGFETHRTATRTIAGLELWRMLKKGQKKWCGDQSAIEQFYSLAA